MIESARRMRPRQMGTANLSLLKALGQCCSLSNQFPRAPADGASLPSEQVRVRAWVEEGLERFP